MPNRTFRIVLAAPLLLAGARASAPEGPAYAVAEGTTLRKTFAETTEWSVVSLTQVANSVELPLPQMDMSGLFEGTLVLVDEYGPVADGRPESLRRTVEHAAFTVDSELSVEGEGEAYSLALASPLDGEVLLFAWDEEEEEHDVELEVPGQASDWLEHLEEDADLRAVLPPAGIDVGGSWSLTADDLAHLLHPGGSWSYWPEEPAEGEYFTFEVEDLLATAFLGLATLDADLEGEGEATWSETREVEGTRLAVIALAFELDADFDATDAYEEALAQARHATDREGIDLEIGWTLEGEGDLLWNLDSGHFESMELRIDGRIDLAMRWIEDYGETEVDVEIFAEIDAETRLEARVGGE